MLISKKSNNFNVDFLGENLARMALIARNMPPAYLGAGIREPIVSHGGGVLGHVLDGKGIYLDTDLKSLGIKGRIPHVFERSRTQRILDKLGGEDGAITTYDGIVNARAAGNMSDFVASKASYTTVANVWSTPYRSAGLPAAGSYASTPGAVKDRTDAGALSLGLATPGSGTDYLLSFGCVAAQQLNMIMVVDMLVAVGNIVATSLVAQTVSSAALTRYTTGAGVNATMEVTTQLGATPANHTMSYTNQAGTAAQTSTSNAMTVSAIIQRLQTATIGPQIQLASGDFGVQAVSTSTLSASMAAGAYAMILYKPLLFLPGLVANLYGERPTSSMIDGLVQLPTASSQIGCLVPLFYTNTTSSGVATMTLRTCYG